MLCFTLGGYCTYLYLTNYIFTMCHWKNNEDIMYSTTKIHNLEFYRRVLHKLI